MCTIAQLWNQFQDQCLRSKGNFASHSLIASNWYRQICLERLSKLIIFIRVICDLLTFVCVFLEIKFQNGLPIRVRDLPLSVQLPVNRFENKLLGFAICAVKQLNFGSPYYASDHLWNVFFLPSKDILGIAVSVFIWWTGVFFYYNWIGVSKVRDSFSDFSQITFSWHMCLGLSRLLKKKKSEPMFVTLLSHTELYCNVQAIHVISGH